MAPELARDGDKSLKSDVYAFGMLIYEVRYATFVVVHNPEKPLSRP